jgi:hypothetical protein
VFHRKLESTYPGGILLWAITQEFIDFCWYIRLKILWKNNKKNESRISRIKPNFVLILQTKLIINKFNNANDISKIFKQNKNVEIKVL